MLVQVDKEEIDRLSGRLRVNRDKFAKYSADKLGIVRTGPSVADVAASLAKRGSISDGQTTDVSRRSSVDSGPQQLPKQSGFVPRSRKSAATNDDEPQPEIPNILRQRSSAFQRPDSAHKAEEAEELPAPTQTSFIQRRLQKQREDDKRKEETERKRQAEIRAAKEKADDLTLKESIAKVTFSVL